MRQRLLKHAGMGPRPLRRASGILVIALLCAVGTFTATAASAATWTGTVHGTRMASNGLVSGGFSWHGSFWFTADRGGAVRGHAVVGYQPLQDLTVLNNALTYVRDVTTDFVNALPGVWGPAINAVGTRQVVGTSAQFRESMGIRRGRISGRLSCTARSRARRCLGGKLTLRWDGELKGINYDIYLRSASQGSGRIGGDVASLPDPFTGVKVGDLVNRRHAVSVHSPEPSEQRPESAGSRVDSYWVAERVS
jgi:hypothetical protein